MIIITITTIIIMMVIVITSDPHKWIRFDGSAIGFIGSVISGSVVLFASSLGLCHQKGKHWYTILYLVQCTYHN